MLPLAPLNMLFQNAFSERLFEHGFNFYDMFVPDLLHEFELGVWKAVFTHLLRILYSCGGDTIQTLNSRYETPASFDYRLMITLGTAKYPHLDETRFRSLMPTYQE